MTNTTLDAAINYADHKVKELYDQKQKRRHARALIAKLLEGMEQEAVFARSYQHGYNDALTEIRRRVGGGVVSTTAIITDAKIQQMHGGNFGSRSPREVVDEGVWSIGFGYSTGSTCCYILHSHKLITNPKSGRYIRLTRKGTLYFRALAKQKGVLT